MHIVECHLEFSGFDEHLVKAGTSVYLWNLVRQFRAAGHRVTAVTPMHGLLPYLQTKHELLKLDWQFVDEVPVRLDPLVWKGFPEEITLSLAVQAYRMCVEGVEMILLSGGLLDTFSDSFYPPAMAEGKDLSFLKPLAFQVAAARFLTERVEAGAIVHLHEPLYHYLLPAALAGRGLIVVSTVQTNMPVNTKVYEPAVHSVLAHLGASTSSLEGLSDPALDSNLHRAMRCYLPRTKLYHEYPERPGHEYISMLALIVRSVAAMDFLSEGQLDHALTQAGTPFEALFQELAVYRELQLHAGKLVVGGCAIGEEWMHVERSNERRERTLTALGLDPLLPTIYHNSRYSVQHKGQRELFRALRRVLEKGERCNVLLHCLAPHPPHDPDLEAIAHDYPKQARVNTGPMTSLELMDWAASSDLSVFPSKFEMDTFLMAMGEAMASGSIPIATAQSGMRHFEHTFDLDAPGSTGLALPRSFRVDDPLLTDAVCDGLHRMLHLLRTNPDRIRMLRGRAVEVATRFTWPVVARRFLAIFEACASGKVPAQATPCAAATTATPVSLPRQIQDAGQGHAHRREQGVEVRWFATNTAAVEVVIPGDPAEVVALARCDDGSFVETLSSIAAEELALLVTASDGTSAWVELTIEDVEVQSGPDVRRSMQHPPPLHIQSVRCRDTAITATGIIHCTALIPEIDIGQAVTLTVAVGPFKVIQQSPRVVRAYLGAIGDRTCQFGKIAAEEGNPARIGNLSALLGIGRIQVTASTLRKFNDGIVIFF